jgi:glycosyltransferase involved in cell wall biosynthesis
MTRSTQDALLIVTHVVHYTWGGRLYAYAPYVREIEVWRRLFGRVVIAAPCRHQEPPDEAAAFVGPDIEIRPQLETGGRGLKAKSRQVMAVPRLVRDLAAAMRSARYIHVRCPGNLGLLALVLAPLFSRYLIAKYAGQWQPFPGEAWTVRLQRVLLASRWWKGPVTVYGNWPGQPPHVVPFFSTSMTAEQLARAGALGLAKGMHRELRILYVGRLSRAKNVDVLVAAVARLYREGCEVRCDILGAGPERPSLERQAVEAGLQGIVSFHGAVPFEKLVEFYAEADVLVLVSETEGWPKAILEGMAHGLVCVGSKRGLVPQILADGRGYVVEPGNVDALAEVLRSLANDRSSIPPMRERAISWASEFSLEKLEADLRQLMSRRWTVPEEWLRRTG